jgi:hypothetical protein
MDTCGSFGQQEIHKVELVKRGSVAVGSAAHAVVGSKRKRHYITLPKVQFGTLGCELQQWMQVPLFVDSSDTAGAIVKEPKKQELAS